MRRACTTDRFGAAPIEWNRQQVTGVTADPIVGVSTLVSLGGTIYTESTW